MASERAKELAERQKAEAKALKEAKKNSTDPKDWGTIRQMRETVKMTVQADPPAKWWLIAALAAPIVVALVAAAIMHTLYYWIYLPLLGILVGLTLAMVALNILSRRALYKRYEGQAGAAQVVLEQLNKKKWTSTPAITANRQQDCVHRTVGPAGIVLVGDGDPQRVRELLTAERKRHEQIAFDVPVTTLSVGKGEGQIPLPKALNAIKKLPRKASDAQITELASRIKALDNVRGRVPLPKGPLPNMKGARKAMRGR